MSTQDNKMTPKEWSNVTRVFRVDGCEFSYTLNPMNSVVILDQFGEQVTLPWLAIDAWLHRMNKERGMGPSSVGEILDKLEAKKAAVPDPELVKWNPSKGSCKAP